MNTDVQLNLALILFLPWYAILVGLYWFYPRQPRTLSRWSFDVSALTVTTLLSVASMQWAYRNADVSVGPMWKQILATSVCYGAFLAAMTTVFFLRRAWIIRPHQRRDRVAATTPNLPQVTK